MLKRIPAGLGQTARVPMLWINTESDQYFGPSCPREWFEGFRASGGVAESVQFAPHGQDGHSLFARFADVWQPTVADFLRQRGFEMKEPR